MATQTRGKKCDPTWKCFIFRPEDLLVIGRPNEALWLKCCGIAESIPGTSESSDGVLLFHASRWKGAVTKRTETDSAGERRKVCLFFLPFVYLDNSDLPLSLSVTVCLPLSLFIITFSLFSFQRFPGGDSASWFSLNYLPAANSHSLCPVRLYLFLCCLFFVILLPSHYLPLNSAIVNSNLSWII